MKILYTSQCLKVYLVKNNKSYLSLCLHVERVVSEVHLRSSITLSSKRLVFPKMIREWATQLFVWFGLPWTWNFTFQRWVHHYSTRWLVSQIWQVKLFFSACLVPGGTPETKQSGHALRSGPSARFACIIRLKCLVAALCGSKIIKHSNYWTTKSYTIINSFLLLLSIRSDFCIKILTKIYRSDQKVSIQVIGLSEFLRVGPLFIPTIRSYCNTC